MRLKNDASTETRLTIRRTAPSSRTTSWPNTRALPPSCSSSVDRTRTSVVLPEPFWPSTATHSPRAIVNETPSSATIRTRLRPSRRTNCLVRPATSTAKDTACSSGRGGTDSWGGQGLPPEGGARHLRRLSQILRSICSGPYHDGGAGHQVVQRALVLAHADHHGAD